MFGKCLEKQITVMLKFCVEFPTGCSFPCEETEVDIEQGQTAHCGAEGMCEGLLCKMKFEKKKQVRQWAWHLIKLPMERDLVWAWVLSFWF